MATRARKRLHEQEPRCVYCGFKTWRNDEQRQALIRDGISSAHTKRAEIWRQATCEHVTPKTNGGASTSENLTIACSYCNSNRKHHPADAFKAWISYAIRHQIHPHQIYDRSGVCMHTAVSLEPFNNLRLGR